MKRIAVIGDIVSSRQLARRAQVQQDLIRTLQAHNKGNPNLLSPYTITIGDEFQALFNRADSLFYDATSILSALYPTKVRFSFGVGTIETPINPHQAIGMDGPAFHNAREGIEELKHSQCLFRITGMDGPCDDLLNQVLCLISHACRKWKASRFKALVMLLQSSPVKEIAEGLRVSESAAYKTIEAGALRTIVDLFEETTRLLNENLEAQ